MYVGGQVKSDKERLRDELSRRINTELLDLTVHDDETLRYYEVTVSNGTHHCMHLVARDWAEYNTGYINHVAEGLVFGYAQQLFLRDPLPLTWINPPA